MKKLLKIFGIALLIIMIVIVIIISVLFIKGKMDEGKAYLTDEYYKDFKSDSMVEMKYSNRGDFETAYTEFDSDNQSIQKIRIWYPKELENTNKTRSQCE